MIIFPNSLIFITEFKNFIFDAARETFIWIILSLRPLAYIHSWVNIVQNKISPQKTRWFLLHSERHAAGLISQMCFFSLELKTFSFDKTQPHKDVLCRLSDSKSNLVIVLPQSIICRQMMIFLFNSVISILIVLKEVCFNDSIDQLLSVIIKLYFI